MKVAIIPFNKWSKDRLQAGKKTCTSRRKPYGHIGDVFYVDGVTYILTDIMQMKLSEIMEHWYQAEGCNSPEEFKQIWSLIHRKIGFIPDMVVYLHCFQRKI